MQVRLGPQISPGLQQTVSQHAWVRGQHPRLQMFSSSAQWTHVPKMQLPPRGQQVLPQTKPPSVHTHLLLTESQTAPPLHVLPHAPQFGSEFRGVQVPPQQPSPGLQHTEPQ
jgi:hypothetical protein